MVTFNVSILNTLPVRAKVKANRSPILLPLQGVGVYTLIAQGVALGYELTALSGRSRRRFELIEFLQRGCGLRGNTVLASDGVTTN